MTEKRAKETSTWRPCIKNTRWIFIETQRVPKLIPFGRK